MRSLLCLLAGCVLLIPMQSRADGEYTPPQALVTYDYSVDWLNILWPFAGTPYQSLMLSHAAQMPAVQKAMAQLDTLGLVRNQSRDLAVASGDSSYAMLAYYSPTQSDVYGMVVVFSVVTDVAASTNVWAGAYSYADTTLSEAELAYDSLESEITDISSHSSGNYTITKKGDFRKLLDYGVCIVLNGSGLCTLSAYCGPYAPACCTVGVIFATIHCAFQAFD